MLRVALLFVVVVVFMLQLLLISRKRLLLFFKVLIYWSKYITFPHSFLLGVNTSTNTNTNTKFQYILILTNLSSTNNHHLLKKVCIYSLFIYLKMGIILLRRLSKQ